MGESIWYESEDLKPSLDDDLLIHYGIKGMKWRHRKGRKYTSKNGRKSKIKIPGENIGQGIWNAIDAYERWQSTTKWGKFLDKLQSEKITDTFSNEAQASDSNDDPKIYWMKGPDGKWHKYKNGKMVK